MTIADHDYVGRSHAKLVEGEQYWRGMGLVFGRIGPPDHNVEQTLDIVDRAYIVFEGNVQVTGTVRELVFNDEVADLYFGPTLTARLRDRLGAAA